MAAKRRTQNITQKFDESVDKFATTLTHLTTGIALHTLRLDSIDAGFASLESKQEQHMAKAESDYRELNNKIDDSAKEVTQHFDKVVEKVVSDWKKEQQEQQDKQKDVDEKLSKRIGYLERWRWMILGGVAVLVIVFEVIKTIATSNLTPYLLHLLKP